MFFGLTAGAPPAFDMRAFYRRQLSLIGTKMGSRADFAAMIAFVERHRITPEIDRVFPFADLNQALAWLDEGAQFGKIGLTFP